MGEEIPHASWPKRKPPTQSLPCCGSEPKGIPSVPRGYLTSGDVVGTGEVGCYWLLGVRDATPHSTAHRTPPPTKDDPPPTKDDPAPESTEQKRRHLLQNSAALPPKHHGQPVLATIITGWHLPCSSRSQHLGAPSSHTDSAGPGAPNHKRMSAAPRARASLHP